MTHYSSVWVDFKTLKSQVSIMEVLDYFRIKMPKGNGSQYYSHCIFPDHAGDRNNPNAFSVNAEKNCWRCMTHCGSGNALELFCKLKGLDPKDAKELREAAILMQDAFSVGGIRTQPPENDSEKPIPASKPVEAKPNPPLSFTLQTKSDIPFLLETKQFPLELLRSFEIGYCAKGMFSGRVTVPIHNRQGQLVAYAGRGLKEADITKRGRWLLPKNFRKSQELFNQHRLDFNAVDDYGLVVVEGFWSALRWHQAGYPVVGLMGCELSDTQLKRITEITDRVWLMLDSDKAGTAAREKILCKLARHLFVRCINYPDDSTDRSQPEDFTPDELTQLIRA